MRANASEPLSVSFLGPEGPYTLDFSPTDESDGIINVEISGTPMQWDVDDVHLESDGTLVLGGLTRGTKPIWNDVYWFELRLSEPPVVRYWGDKVVWRVDAAA